MRRTVLGLVLAVCAAVVAAAPADAGPACAGVAGTRCGVHVGGQEFHGLVAVTGAPWVLDLAARAGGRGGCADCTWTVVLACPRESLAHPDTLAACAQASGAPPCPRRQLLYRVYLSTGASADRDEGTVCLGGPAQVVPIGDRAAGDVERYLEDVTPPDLSIETRPGRATLSGLPTYFTAHPPAALAPTAFGGPTVTETISIRAARIRWTWGDGSATGWLPAARRASHTYRRGGVAAGRLDTRWSASYTVGYAGRTFGPYDATGTLARSQPFRLPVRTSTPVLVSS